MKIDEKRKLQVLAVFPATHRQIREKLRIGKDTTRLALKALRAEKRCHIGGWDVSQKRPAAIYHEGPGEDVPSSEAAVVRGERAAAPASKTVRRDPLVAALFGPARP